MGAQVWVTGTDARDYLDISPGEHAMFHVKQGRVEAA
jgi:recombinational DNA repair ATPase RecF